MADVSAPQKNWRAGVTTEPGDDVRFLFADKHRTIGHADLLRANGKPTAAHLRETGHCAARGQAEDSTDRDTPRRWYQRPAGIVFVSVVLAAVVGAGVVAIDYNLPAIGSFWAP